MAQTEDKKMPNNVDYENYVLGCLMTEKDIVDKVIDIISKDCFYKPENGKIYEAILSLYVANKEICILTVVEKLHQDNSLDYVGGSYYVASLTKKVGSCSSIERYAKIIAQKYIQREMIKTLYQGYEDAYNSAIDIADTIESVQKRITELTQGTKKNESSKVSDVIGDVLNNIEEASKRGDGISGVPTGFYSLDKVTQGWQNSNMIIIGGRPAMGKTTFAVSMAVNMAKQGVKSLILSLEMSKAELVTRILSMESQVDQTKLRSGQLNENDWFSIESSINTLQQMGIYIDDEGAITPTQMKNKCRINKRKYDIDIVIIDYLQLMRIPGNNNKVNEVSEISASIKALAKELNTPIIALSQLSREGAKKEGKPPSLTDLRDSGSIEQDADIVCFVHRPEYYGLQVTEDGESTENLAQIVIAKYRNGSTGTVNLKFNGPLAKFEEWDY